MEAARPEAAQRGGVEVSTIIEVSGMFEAPKMSEVFRRRFGRDRRGAAAGRGVARRGDLQRGSSP